MRNVELDLSNGPEVLKRVKFSEFIKGKEEMIIKELGERLKDIAFMHGLTQIREALERVMDTEVRGGDTITISWDIVFVVNDVIQIVGREERGKND